MSSYIPVQLYQQQLIFTLTIGANAVATEAFVTGKNYAYLTALPATASFTTLTTQLYFSVPIDVVNGP